MGTTKHLQSWLAQDVMKTVIYLDSFPGITTSGVTKREDIFRSRVPLHRFSAHRYGALMMISQSHGPPNMIPICQLYVTVSCSSETSQILSPLLFLYFFSLTSLCSCFILAFQIFEVSPSFISCLKILGQPRLCMPGLFTLDCVLHNTHS